MSPYRHYCDTANVLHNERMSAIGAVVLPRPIETAAQSSQYTRIVLSHCGF